MLGFVAGSEAPHRLTSFAGPFRFGKQILNALGERAAEAAELSRFAALSPRLLDDVGITEAERAAVLGYDEPSTDGWRVVASHL